MVTICSIDIGVKHLAIIIFDPVTNRILYWTIHTLNLVNGSFSQSISSLMSKALPFMTETVAIVIEKQIRCRGMAFQKHGMDNCLVEAGVEQFFINKMPLALTLLFDTRHKLTRHGIDMRDINLKKTPKTQSKQICSQYLIVNIQDKKIFDFYNDYPDKKDDLSDCLLQGLAYYNMNRSLFLPAPRFIDLTDN